MSSEIPCQPSQSLDQPANLQQTERELRELKQKLSFLMEHSPVAVIEWGTGFEVLNWNAAAAEIFGFKRSEAIGRHAAELIVPASVKQAVDQVFQLLLRQKGGTRSVNENLTKEGRTIVCEWYNAPIANSEGEVVGVTSMAVDITSRWHTEQSLRTYVDKAAELYNNAPCGYHSLSPDGVFIQINNTELSWLGCSREALIGKKQFVEFLTPQSQELFQENFAWLEQQNWLKELELELVRAGGETMPVLLNATAVKDADGNFVMSRSTLFDIRERKQAEAALRFSNQRIANILASITDAFFSLDTHWQFTYLNTQAEKLIQRTAEDLLGKNIWQEFPQAIASTFYREYHRAMAEKITVTFEEFYPPSETWLEVRVYPFEGGLSICFRDITDRKQIELALYQANEELEERVERRTTELRTIILQLQQEIRDRKQIELALQDKAEQLEQALQELQRTQSQMIQSEKMSSLGQLVAGVAHEINNPVNFIYGNLNHANDYTQSLIHLLQQYQHSYPNPVTAIRQETEAIDLDFLMQDLPKLLSSMRVGAERIQKIVASLRTFSRMDEAEFKTVDLHDGLESTLMILQNRLKPKADRPEIAVVRDYGNLPLVECYAGQLNQVFMNILSNAIDALDEKFKVSERRNNEESPLLTLSLAALSPAVSPSPCLTITTHCLNRQSVIIKIADNGTGMTETIRRRIFDPFFTTKPVGKGTGMGMSISYQIVTEKHSGSLQCHSALGQGTELMIEIPLRQSPNGLF